MVEKKQRSGGGRRKRKKFLPLPKLYLMFHKFSSFLFLRFFSFSYVSYRFSFSSSSSSTNHYLSSLFSFCFCSSYTFFSLFFVSVIHCFVICPLSFTSIPSFRFPSPPFPSHLPAFLPLSSAFFTGMFSQRGNGRENE